MTEGKIVTLTDIAAKKIREFIEKEGEASSGLRVKVDKDPAGRVVCELVIGDSPTRKDAVLYDKHVKLYIDSESAPLLLSSRIGYVQSDKGSGFRITNPNFSCGCGLSCSCQN